MSPCIVRHVKRGKQRLLGPRQKCCMSNRATQYIQKYGVFCRPNSFKVLGLERRGGGVVDCRANYSCYLTRLSVVVEKQEDANNWKPSTRAGLASRVV